MSALPPGLPPIGAGHAPAGAFTAGVLDQLALGLLEALRLAFAGLCERTFGLAHRFLRSREANTARTTQPPVNRSAVETR